MAIPLDLSPALWLAADQGIAASPIATWSDQSGNSRNATQAIEGKRPVLDAAALNGLPVVHPDGSDDYLARDASVSSQPTTLCVLCRSLDTAQSDQFVFDGLGTGRQAFIFTESGSGHAVAFWAGGTVLGYSTGADIGGWHIYTAVFNGASSALYVDGTSKATGNAGTNALGGITVGAAYLRTYGFFDGQIAEMIIFPSALSDANRQAVEQYLYDKWIAPPASGFPWWLYQQRVIQ